MTVRSIVEMFESMAAASVGAGSADHSVESPERGNVYGLVTYYDGLAEAEEPPLIVATKTVRLVWDHPAMSECVPQPKEAEQEQQQQEDSQPSNQDSSEAPAVRSAPSPPSKLVRKYAVPLSKLPQPKSREFHLAACSVRKPISEDASRSLMSSSSSNDAVQPLYVPPPTPVSVRVRASGASYAAFVARIENSQSRLLDFEKDERWLGQIESMKGRVEALKKRNHIALAREVASTPRKTRSMSECSGVSTASTASMSSMDTPEISCQ